MTLTVNSSITASIHDTICKGSSYNFNGTLISVAGIYNDTISSSTSGCNSIITLHLYVNPTVTNNISDAICQGDSYNFGTQIITSAGVYNDTLQTSLGCDSVVILTLTVNNPDNTHLRDSICQGATYSFGGRILTSAGTYTDSLQNQDGCDSIVTLVLSIHSSINININDTICQGDSLQFGSTYYNASGTYYDSLQTIYGCDSIVTLNLTVLTKPTVIANANADTIGVGGTVLFNPNGSNASTYLWNFGDGFFSNLNTVTHTFNTPGVYNVILEGTLLNGCPSYDTITIVVINDISIKKIDLNTKITIYPNPTANDLFISFDLNKTDKVAIKLFASNGQLIYTNEVEISTGVEKISLADLERGMYTLHINTGHNQLVKKVILTK